MNTPTPRSLGTILEAAHAVGAAAYTPPPTRMVQGVSFTYDQLIKFVAKLTEVAPEPLSVTRADCDSTHEYLCRLFLGVSKAEYKELEASIQNEFIADRQTVAASRKPTVPKAEHSVPTPADDVTGRAVQQAAFMNLPDTCQYALKYSLGSQHLCFQCMEYQGRYVTPFKCHQPQQARPEIPQPKPEGRTPPKEAQPSGEHPFFVFLDESSTLTFDEVMDRLSMARKSANTGVNRIVEFVMPLAANAESAARQIGAYAHLFNFGQRRDQSKPDGK